MGKWGDWGTSPFIWNSIATATIEMYREHRFMKKWKVNLWKSQLSKTVKWDTGVIYPDITVECCFHPKNLVRLIRIIF